MTAHDLPDPAVPPNVWMLSIERDATSWIVATLADGQRRVVSRHPTHASAAAAVETLSASGQVRDAGGGTPT